MTDNAQPEEYRVILQAVPEEAVDAVAWELMLLFPLDRGPALQVARAAPIVLVDKLDAAQVHNVETYLGCLRRFGAEVIVTSEVDTAMKRLNWPRMPHIARHPANVLICPNCGVRLSVDAVASHSEPSVLLAPGHVRQNAAPAPQTPPAPPRQPAQQQPQKPATQPAVSQPQQQATRPAPVAVPEPPAEDDAPLRLLDDLPESPKPAGTWKLVEDEEQQPQSKPAGQPGVAPPVRPMQSQPPPKPFRPAPPLKENVPFSANVGAAGAPGAADSTSVNNDNTNAGGEGNCRVSLIKKLKPTERKPVAALIAKYQGISFKEAQKAASKSVVTILRNATKEQAEECRKEFKSLGFNVQVME